MLLFQHARASALAALTIAASARAQLDLYGFDFAGNFHRINQNTGAATLVAHTGFTRLNAGAADPRHTMFSFHLRDPGNAADTNKLILVQGGAGWLRADYGAANDLRALAYAPGDRLLGIRDGPVDELVSINVNTGAVSLIGPTGQSDIEGLTATSFGELYAVGTTPPGRLYRVDAGTGAAALISTICCGFDPDELRSIEWAGGSRAWTGRTSLWTLDLTSGAVTPVGPFGGGIDMRGLAAVCYADCDGTSYLNVEDFVCFMSAFAARGRYADCDQSTEFNVNDFVCFQSQFAAGCP